MLEQLVPLEEKGPKGLPDKQAKMECQGKLDTLDLPDQLVRMVKLDLKEA